MSIEDIETSLPVSISTLPDELLIQVIARTAHTSLPVLALVSRRFHKSVFPELYRFVHLLGNNRAPFYSSYLAGRIPNWESRDPFAFTYPQTPHRDSTINRLSLFLRTIHESESLRLAVIGASFEWGHRCEREISNALRLLSPSITFVHFSPATYKLSTGVHTPTTSLSIQSHDLQVPYPEGQSYQNKLYNIFRIPSLRKLSLRGVWSWDSFHNLYNTSRWRTSPVTCLSFTDSVCAGADLVEVLNWPQALKSFYFQAFSQHRGFTPYGLPGDEMDLVDILCYQQESLEELFLIGDVVDQDSTAMHHLHGFTRLKRLRLPLELMVLPVLHPDPDFEEEQPEQKVPFCKTVPPLIEQLQAEIFPVSTWDDMWEKGDEPYSHPTRMDMAHKAIQFSEFSPWLNELLAHKSVYYPRLREVVIWQQEASDLAPVFQKLEAFYPGGAELAQAFKDADIEFSWVECCDSPIFYVSA